ncbi:MAG: patatin-like phospholipase family protein [Candidatus Zixiibacteriota bacterium]
MKSVLYIFLAWSILWLGVSADTTQIFIGWDGKSYYPVDQGPRIGLALSGGGARGLAQVGILKAFEETGINIGAIAGTSIGGIIGGLYASGYNAAELDSIIREIDFNELFSNRPKRTTTLLTQREEMERYLISIRFDGLKPFIPQALTSGQKLLDLLSRLTLRANYVSGGDFSKLDIPFVAITTDIITGEEVVIGSGNLADAMRSTMAFPLAFTGIELEEMLLMDGGMVDPVPVNIARNVSPGLDLIVAVNTTSRLLTKDEINDPIDIANQVTSIMSMDKLQAALDAADIVIEPPIPEIHSTDFQSIDTLINRGYEAGLKAANEIYEQCSIRCSLDSVYLAHISFGASGPYWDTANFPFHPGMTITRERLQQAANDLYIKERLISISIKVSYGGRKVDGYDAVDLTVEASPSPPINECHIVVQGNTVFDDSTITNLINPDDGFINARDLQDLSSDVVNLYKLRGYDLAHIRNLSYDPATNNLMIDIDEAIVKRIMVVGNDRTKMWLIKSNYPQALDSPFNSRLAAKGVANIYATDLFDRVTIHVVPGADGAVAKISVKEKKYTQMRVGWHLHDDYKNETFLEVLDDNLFGTGQEFLAHAQYADRRQKYELTLKANRFFSTYFTYRVTGFYHYLDRKIYNDDGESIARREENRYGFDFTLGHQIARFGTVIGGIGWTDVENEFSPGGGTSRSKLRTISLLSRVENINRFPFPTKGKKHIFSAQFATDVLGADAQYTKIFSSVESFWPLPAGFNFHPTISLGLSDAKAGIPVSERYYIGGHYSFYGFAYEELNGSKMFLTNLELRLSLPYRFYLYSRYDFGQVYGAFDDIKLKNMRHGYGFSIALDSPIGPIDFGYGKSGNHPDRLYLDIGLVF